jgi:hypothetical protein
LSDVGEDEDGEEDVDVDDRDEDDEILLRFPPFEEADVEYMLYWWLFTSMFIDGIEAWYGFGMNLFAIILAVFGYALL